MGHKMDFGVTRRGTAAVALCLLLLFAGCSSISEIANMSDDVDTGLGEQNTLAAGGDDTSSDPANATTTTATGPTEPTTISENYTFSEGESYTYEVSAGAGSQTSNLTWTVTDVSDGTVTVEVASTTSGGTTATTISAPQGQIFQTALDAEQAFTPSFFAALTRYPVAVSASQNLSTGSSWTATGDSMTLDPSSNSRIATPIPATVTVTGTESVNDIDCSTIQITDQSGDTTTEACVTPGYPFVLSVSTGSQNSGFTLTLLDANRP